MDLTRTLRGNIPFPCGGCYLRCPDLGQLGPRRLATFFLFRTHTAHSVRTVHAVAGTFNVQGTGAYYPDNLVILPCSLVEITVTLFRSVAKACLEHGHRLAKGPHPPGEPVASGREEPPSFFGDKGARSVQLSPKHDYCSACCIADRSLQYLTGAYLTRPGLAAMRVETQGTRIYLEI